MKFDLSSQERPRALAKSLKSILKRMGGDISLSASQAAVSRMLGYRDWHDLARSAGTGEPGIDDAFCAPEVVSARRVQQIAVLTALGYDRAAAGRIVDTLHPTSCTRPVVGPTSNSIEDWPWKVGEPVFRSTDGIGLPFEPASRHRYAAIDLVYGPPGHGKSVLLSKFALAHLRSWTPEAPSRVGMLSVGPAFEGLTDLARDELPDDRKHGIVSIRLEDSPESAVNPFDTRPGWRRPTPDGRMALVNLLMLLATDRTGAPPPGTEGLVGFCIDEAYATFDDREPGSSPRRYSPGVDRTVDESLAAIGFDTAAATTWWSVVDALFVRGLHGIAARAQRHAVPRLSDLPSVVLARRPTVSGPDGDSDTEVRFLPLLRILLAANEDHGILSGPTTVDIGDYRLAVVDVATTSRNAGWKDEKRAAVMALVGRFLLTKDLHPWRYDPVPNPPFPEIYLTHHEEDARRARRTCVQLVYDETHRFDGCAQWRRQIENDVRECRKSGTAIAVASQLVPTFERNVVDLAAGIWICGLREGQVAEAVETFRLDPAVAGNFAAPGPSERRPHSSMLVRLEVQDGAKYFVVLNDLSPEEAWALTSAAEDVHVRRTTTRVLGAVDARRRLAASFPKGSVRDELQRRLKAREEEFQPGTGGYPAYSDASETTLAAIAAELVSGSPEVRGSS